jgi:dienelactone hydrolase
MTAARMSRVIAVLLACAFTAQAAMARLVEEQRDVEVSVVDAYNKPVTRAIKLTIFHDDKTPAPRPVIVINHGRAAEAAERASMGRARFSDTAKWFAGMGFAVAVPTRIGYGVTGGDDVEETGTCTRRNYPPGYLAAAEQTMTVLRFMHERDDTVKDRDVVLGQSFGGATSIAVSSLAPPGVVTAINFAGGGGGNPKTQPQQPCSPVQLERMFAQFGKTSRMPTLWVYTENDMYFGPRYPREWFEAFQKAGGVGEFVQFPPHGEDGHGLFVKHPATWRPLVLDFLRKQGFDLEPAKP